MDKRTSRVAASALVAAAVGYIAGVLTAPKSGAETRKDIKKAANQRINEAEKQLKKMHTDLNDLLAKATDRAKTLKGSAQDEAHAAVSKAAKAKEKVRIALSSTRDGEATDDDLKKAISDAESAIKHLKEFLKH
jgi:gas vesicle protein